MNLRDNDDWLSSRCPIPVPHIPIHPLHSPAAVRKFPTAANHGIQFIKMESGMNKSMAVLAVLMAGQFSLAHAADQPLDHLDHHPFLTDDPSEFEYIRPQHDMVNVNFSSAAGQTAPFFVESTVDEFSYVVGVFGRDYAQSVTSANGLPATYWFGDQAESTFVLANGSVQIVLSDEVIAASMQLSGDEDWKMLRSPDTHEVGQIISVTLVDANGLMVGQQTITDLSSTSGGPAFLGILSDIPFRSVIISSTAETWMFSNLNYAVDQEEPALIEGKVVSGTPTAGEEKLTSCDLGGSGNTEAFKSGTVVSALGVQPLCANSHDY